MRQRVVITLAEIDRVRWQGAADLKGLTVERLVRDAVEAAIEELERRDHISTRTGRGR